MTLRKLHHRAIFHLEEYFFIDEKRKFEFLISCPVKLWHMYKHLLEARQTSQFRNYMGVFFFLTCFCWLFGFCWLWASNFY